MSIDSCGFGREPDGFCTDSKNLEQRAVEAGLIARTRERMRQRMAEKTLMIATEDVDKGDNDGNSN